MLGETDKQSSLTRAAIVTSGPQPSISIHISFPLRDRSNAPRMKREPGRMAVSWLRPLAAELAGMALLLCGCATQPQPISKVAWPTPVGAEPLRFTAMGLVSNSCPATFSFQKARGKLGSAKAELNEAAGLGLGAPVAGVATTGTLLQAGAAADSTDDMVVAGILAGTLGPAVTVGAALAAPVVATKGLIRSWKKLSPAELAEREAALAKAMSEMAQQDCFRTILLKAAAEAAPDRLLLWDTNAPAPSTVDMMLDVRVEDLRLEPWAPTKLPSFCGSRPARD